MNEWMNERINKTRIACLHEHNLALKFFDIVSERFCTNSQPVTINYAKPPRKECCSPQGKKPPYQQPGNGKNLVIKMDLTPRATTGGETTPCREKQTAGWGKVSNALMDNQKRQNTENQEERLGRNSHRNNYSINNSINSLKCVYTNIDGILNRLELLTIIQDEKPDIVGITKISPKNEAPEINVRVYVIFYDLASRGMCLYIKEELNSVQVNFKLQQGVFCSIQLWVYDKLLVGCIYRSTNNSPELN